jgi:hypothetical protein
VLQKKGQEKTLAVLAPTPLGFLCFPLFSCSAVEREGEKKEKGDGGRRRRKEKGEEGGEPSAAAPGGTGVRPCRESELLPSLEEDVRGSRAGTSTRAWEHRRIRTPP